MTENGTLLLSVAAAAKLLGISRNLCYDLVHEGRIPHVRLGRRVLVSKRALEGWIERESGVAPNAADGVESSVQRGQ